MSNRDSGFSASTQSTDSCTPASAKKGVSYLSTLTHTTDPGPEPSHPSVYRCTLCSPPKPNLGKARNIIVCIDGTSNQFGRKNTNVVKLFAQVDLESQSPSQYAYYSSGIGTRPKSLRGGLAQNFSDYLGLAIAWNVEDIVKDAYGWLARTYNAGDRIYLFGFSRGAFQVRVLAGMIYEVGLIRTTTDKQIGTAYDYYQAIRSKKPKTRQLAREFKRTFSWEGLRVHFVGVWDTVSSVGLIKEDVFLSNSSSAAHACHFRHALALDELRVKFMPEYFHEMNSESMYKRTPTSKKNGTTSGQDSTTTGNTSDAEDVKEVWFAGCHSDVGGTNRPGSSYQAGNASLLWMRKEAAEKGLTLKPTEIAWVPDDLDFGISDSMSFWWQLVEGLPIRHQTYFSGAGQNSRRWHLSQPRRIIPGQKVHASVLYARAYKPLATLGEGFDVPLIHAEPGEAIPESGIWEDKLFDDTAAQGLLDYISDGEGIAPIYLDRLLFMMRFKEGRECVKKVDGWQAQLKRLIEESVEECVEELDRGPAKESTSTKKAAKKIVKQTEKEPDKEPDKPIMKMSFIGLVALVACYEAAEGTALEEFESYIFTAARECLLSILVPEKHPDGPRVVALLKPLTNHKDLRMHILTDEVLKSLVKLLDKTLKQPGGDFGHAMNGLSCLLQCDETWETFVSALRDPPDTELKESPSTKSESKQYHKSRLARILEFDDARLLTAALRMVLTLAKILNAKNAMEEDKKFWSDMKRRVRQLAQRYGRLVGRLAVEISLVLYDANDEKSQRLNIDDSRVRANFASVLMCLKSEKYNSADGQGVGVGPEGEMLKKVFGFGADHLEDDHKKHIGKLKSAIKWFGARERTAGTLTFLKLSEDEAIRKHFCSIKLIEVFVNKLQSKESALLAAYALVTFLERHEDGRPKYPELAQRIMEDEHLPRYIVGMLRLDYFDDAIGQTEGFKIFRRFMEDGELRKKIQKYNIADVLSEKLQKGEPKETRTSLICLEIFLSFEPNGPWAKQLVKNGLEYLRPPEWEKQKAGVIILSALAQTQNGSNAIKGSIPHIINWLLPDNYRSIREVPKDCPLSPNKRQSRKTCSWMMGPACALRILAQNEDMRQYIRHLKAYSQLKNLHLIGALVSESDTSPLHIWTPNRIDVSNMLDKMIKAVDEEKSGQGLTSIEDEGLPQIKHWHRLIADTTLLSIMVGVSILSVPAVILAPPIYVSAHASAWVSRSLKGQASRARNRHAINSLRISGGDEDPPAEHPPAEDADESAESGALNRLLRPRGSTHSISNRLRARISPSLTTLHRRLNSMSSTRRTNPRSSGNGSTPFGREGGEPEAEATELAV